MVFLSGIDETLMRVTISLCQITSADSDARKTSGEIYMCVFGMCACAMKELLSDVLRSKWIFSAMCTGSWVLYLTHNCLLSRVPIF